MKQPFSEKMPESDGVQEFESEQETRERQLKEEFIELASRIETLENDIISSAVGLDTMLRDADKLDIAQRVALNLSDEEWEKYKQQNEEATYELDDDEQAILNAENALRLITEKTLEEINGFVCGAVTSSSVVFTRLGVSEGQPLVVENIAFSAKGNRIEVIKKTSNYSNPGITEETPDPEEISVETAVGVLKRISGLYQLISAQTPEQIRKQLGLETI